MGENTEYVATLAANKAAVDLLGFAKNRLAKFYNHKLYKAPPKRELSAEDRINVNFGGTAPPTPPPGGIAGTGVTAAASFLQVDDSDASSDSELMQVKKSSEEAGGVTAMMDLLKADLQKDYEQFMADSSKKRKIDAQVVEDKEASKAELE